MIKDDPEDSRSRSCSSFPLLAASRSRFPRSSAPVVTIGVSAGRSFPVDVEVSVDADALGDEEAVVESLALEAVT